MLLPDFLAFIIKLDGRLEANLLQNVVLGLLGFHAHLKDLTLVLVQGLISRQAIAQMMQTSQSHSESRTSSCATDLGSLT